MSFDPETFVPFEPPLGVWRPRFNPNKQQHKDIYDELEELKIYAGLRGKNSDWADSVVLDRVRFALEGKNDIASIILNSGLFQIYAKNFPWNACHLLNEIIKTRPNLIKDFLETDILSKLALGNPEHCRLFITHFKEYNERKEEFSGAAQRILNNNFLRTLLECQPIYCALVIRDLLRIQPDLASEILENDVFIDLAKEHPGECISILTDILQQDGGLSFDIVKNPAFLSVLKSAAGASPEHKIAGYISTAHYNFAKDLTEDERKRQGIEKVTQGFLFTEFGFAVFPPVNLIPEHQMIISDPKNKGQATLVTNIAAGTLNEFDIYLRRSFPDVDKRYLKEMLAHRSGYQSAVKLMNNKPIFKRINFF